MNTLNKIFIILVILLSQFMTCALHAQSTISTGETTIEHAILVEINAYRKQHHLNPLSMNKHIAQQAKAHSLDMATHKAPFGHTGFMDRVKVIRNHVRNAGAAAENVAYNYKNAHDVVKNWLLSPGHKRNIRGNYNLTGIGVVRDKQGKLHFTQVFVKTTNQSA